MPDAPVALAAWIETTIREIVAGPRNALWEPGGEPAWAEPLIGFAHGDDPLFLDYKEHVGPEHWTPAEAYALAYPQAPAPARELTVIAWVLPQTEATRADSRAATHYPPERWARSRIFGEGFNDELRRAVVAALAEHAYPAVAPAVAPQFRSLSSERFVYTSTWSERHAAYACGLGTFGLSDGLITPRGKAHRVGSVVARLRVPATPRPYTDHHAYCLFYSQGTCGACMDRCPVGAITAAGHDKAACRAHVNTTRPFVREQYGFEGYGCGLCQTGVPCEAGIPPRARG
jgi:ferredoxin